MQTFVKQGKLKPIGYVKTTAVANFGNSVVAAGTVNGTYYGLDEVGARVWSLIQEPRSVAALRDAITDEYDVEPERCERDLLALLQELEAAELIEVRDALGT